MMLKVLNSKEKKHILSRLEQQFGFKGELDYVFLRNDKDKLFLVNNDLARVDLSQLRVDSIGMYFAGFMQDGLRLTIEGSQLIGKECKHNILEIGKQQAHDWIRGLSLDISKEDGFYLVKYNNDFFGSGKIKNNKLLNYVSKSRKLCVVND